MRRHAVLATLALVAVTAIWGSTFVVVKRAIEDVPPLEFLALRFAAGAAALAFVWRSSLRRAGPALRGGLVAGVALAAGYGFQTFGLRDTGATNAGFITGLFVVFTPVIAALVLRRAPSRAALAGVVLATAGLALLSLRASGFGVSGGDLLVLLCAVAFAAHIVALGRFAPEGDHRPLAVAQLAVAAIIFAALAPFGGWRAPATGRVWFALALTSLGATSFAFAVQTWVQASLSSTRTAVVLTMEPAFAGLFGFLLLGERLPVRGWVGAGLILCGMLAAELRPGSPREEA